MRKAIMELLDDQRKTLKLFALGALLFFIGLGIIQFGNKTLEPSLEQEIYALLGSIVGGLGFFTALTAQIFLIIFRFKHMGKRN
ncbi:MAG: hypothetical protein ACI92E_000971 [Oceanicoccus sp.]|jgi:hypothetical protein